MKLRVNSINEVHQLVCVALVFHTQQRLWPALWKVGISISSSILKTSGLQRDISGVHWFFTTRYSSLSSAKLGWTGRIRFTQRWTCTQVTICILITLKFTEMSYFHLRQGLRVGLEISLWIKLIQLLWKPSFWLIICGLAILLVVSCDLVLMTNLIILYTLELVQMRGWPLWG